MHIVHMISHLRLGAGRYIADLALEQARRQGNTVALLTSPDTDGTWKSDPAMLRELADGGVTNSSPGDFFHRESRTLFAAAAVIRAMRETPGRDAVYHAHSAMAAAVARWAGARTVVCTCHGWNLSRLHEYELQDALAYQLCHAVTSPSRFWADRLREDMGVPAVEVVPVGLDLRKFPAPPARAPDDDACRIVSVGELTARKGFDVLLEAMRLVWPHAPDAELHILGDGDMSGQLRRKAQSFGDAARLVRFHGFVRDPYRELPQYSLFCLASRSDNLPVAIIEAMLARLPVVATDVGGVSELVRDGDCGWLAQPDSPIGLAEKLVRVIRMEAEERDRLGANGERFARERFAIGRIADEFDTVYRKALSGRRPA